MYFVAELLMYLAYDLVIHAEKQITMENEYGLNMHFRVCILI